jgi:hypothetical protein
MLFYPTPAAVERTHLGPRTRTPEQHTMYQQGDAFRQEDSDV